MTLVINQRFLTFRRAIKPLVYSFHMKGEQRERWQNLCALAAEEQDPQRLLELIREISELLEEKERRLQKQANQNE
jgi:hypothetical protein